MTQPFFAWALDQPDALIPRRWGDQVLVWHRLSGDTHLLTGAAAAIFDRLQQGQATTAQLHHDLAVQAPGPLPSTSSLEATLREMMRRGLVSAHPL
jgi:PqqD family protein of HPr-rel-A system